VVALLRTPRGAPAESKKHRSLRTTTKGNTRHGESEEAAEPALLEWRGRT